jgi:hypothetical protein
MREVRSMAVARNEGGGAMVEYGGVTMTKSGARMA